LQCCLQVAIPVAGDQPANAREAERVGIGLQIPFGELTEEKLLRSVRRVLEEPSFAARAKEHGQILMDQKEHPVERAVWWIEHVIRHPGMKHLRLGKIMHINYQGANTWANTSLALVFRSPIHDLAWYEYFLLDVVAFLVLAPLVFLYITFKLIAFCCCRRKAKPAAAAAVAEKDKRKKRE
jgi:hypothetical protein